MEIELKYSIKEAKIATEIWEDKDLNRIKCRDSKETISLSAIYYDTADYDLQKNMIAFRLRQEGDKLIATVKWQGGNTGPLHKREELNIELGSGAFPEEPLAEIFSDRVIGKQILKIIDGKELLEVMRVDVLRRLFRVDMDESILEVALDSGEIITSLGREPISEIEIELVEGSEQALIKIGETLQGKYNLEPEQRSKFARGLALLRRINIQEDGN